MANRLAVPAGSTASAASVPTNASEAARTVPSPPHTITVPAPPFSALRVAEPACLALLTANHGASIPASPSACLSRLRSRPASLSA